MAVKKKPFVKLRCEECKKINYFVHKSKEAKATVKKKLGLKKFCRWCHRHTLHKEMKK